MTLEFLKAGSLRAAVRTITRPLTPHADLKTSTPMTTVFSSVFKRTRSAKASASEEAVPAKPKGIDWAKVDQPELVLQRFPSRRSQVYGTKGVVSSSQPLATEAGLEILRKGGNAGAEPCPV